MINNQIDQRLIFFHLFNQKQIQNPQVKKVIQFVTIENTWCGILKKLLQMKLTLKQGLNLIHIQQWMHIIQRQCSYIINIVCTLFHFYNLVLHSLYKMHNPYWLSITHNSGLVLETKLNSLSYIQDMQIHGVNTARFFNDISAH